MTNNRPVSEMVEMLSARLASPYAEGSNTIPLSRTEARRLLEALASSQSPSDDVVERAVRAFKRAAEAVDAGGEGSEFVAFVGVEAGVRAALAAIPSAVPSDDVVERVARLIDPGIGSILDDPHWDVEKWRRESGRYAQAMEKARVIIAAIPSAGGVEEMREALKSICRETGRNADGLIDWQRCVDRIQNIARAALAAIPAGGVEEKLAIPPTDGSQYHRPAWMGENCPTRTTCAMHGRCMPIIGHDCRGTLNTSASPESTGK